MNIDVTHIESILAERGMTKADLSKASNVSRTSIYQIMGRGTCEPVTVGKIAKALNVEVGELILKNRYIPIGLENCEVAVLRAHDLVCR